MVSHVLDLVRVCNRLTGQSNPYPSKKQVNDRLAIAMSIDQPTG